MSFRRVFTYNWRIFYFFIFRVLSIATITTTITTFYRTFLFIIINNNKFLFFNCMTPYNKLDSFPFKKKKTLIFFFFLFTREKGSRFYSSCWMSFFCKAAHPLGHKLKKPWIKSFLFWYHKKKWATLVSFLTKRGLGAHCNYTWTNKITQLNYEKGWLKNLYLKICLEQKKKKKTCYVVHFQVQKKKWPFFPPRSYVHEYVSL